MTTESRILLTLTVHEARRLFRNPALVAGTVGSAYLVWRWTTRWAPVWPEMSAWMAGALLPLATTSWFTAAWLAARDRRNGTTELVDATPTSERLREVAFLLSGVAPLVMAAAVILVGGVFVAFDAVGTPRWWEIVGGVAMVAFAWVGGFALGHFSSLLAVLAFPMLAHWTIVASPDVELGAAAETGRLGLAGIAPWIPPSIFDPAEQALLRPSALHTGFLLLLTATVAALFLLRNERRLWAMSAAALLLVSTVLTARRLIALPTPLWDWAEATATQPCERRTGVTYCFYPMYRPWVGEWAETVETLAALAPVDLTAVVQQPGDEVLFGPFAGRDDVVAAPIRWDRRGRPPLHRFVFAARVAATAVGLDSQSCSAAGQGRLAFVLWAASVASRDEGTVIGNPNRVGGLVTRWRPDPATIDLVATLTTRDVEEVATVFSTHLDDLQDPATSTARVAEWFDVTILATSGTEDAALLRSCR